MVFTTGAETTQTEQTNGQEQQQTTASFVQQLVQAKGENWSDPEVLAKGKLEADTYIKTLESQLEQMREDLKKQEYQRQVLEQLQTKAAETATANTVGANNKGSTEGQNTTASLSEDDLKSLVEKTLSQREKDALIKQNLIQVDKALTETFGTEALSTVQKKAAELGMSVDRLKDIAAESPTAFFALIGEKPKTPFSPMTQGSVRTEGVNMQVSTDRNWAFYQKLRRENPNEYYSPKMQQQLIQDKIRMGDKFGNT